MPPLHHGDQEVNTTQTNKSKAQAHYKESIIKWKYIKTSMESTIFPSELEGNRSIL